MEGIVRDRCPLCGGKIVVSDLYQTSRDFEVRKGGKVSRRYTVTDCGSMEVSVAGCADRCGAYWDADSFYIGADGKFYDQKYHEGGEDHDVSWRGPPEGREGRKGVCDVREPGPHRRDPDRLCRPRQTDPSELSALLRTKAVSGLEALILEWPRRSARASRRRSSIPYLKAATSSSAPSAVLTLHGPKPESRASVRSADNP